MDILRNYSNSQGSENPVLSLISDATRCKTPTGNRNKKRLQQRVRRLSEDEVDQLVSGYQQGDSVYTLGRRFGIHRVTVSEHLRRAGIETRLHKRVALSETQLDEARRLRASGMSFSRIATVLGATPYLVRRELTEA